MKMTQHGYETGLGKLLYFLFTAIQILSFAGLIACTGAALSNMEGDQTPAIIMGFMSFALFLTVTVIKVATMAMIGATSVAFGKYVGERDE